MQSTRPQTIGYSLSDSPVGLLAWIYEKLVTWTDEYPFTDDEGQFVSPRTTLACVDIFSALHCPQFWPGFRSTGFLVRGRRRHVAFTTKWQKAVQLLMPLAQKYLWVSAFSQRNLWICQERKFDLLFTVIVISLHLYRICHSWVSAYGNVVFTSEHTSGGHFAAFEKPDELVGDVRKMFGNGGRAFGVVPGKTGYSKL